MRATGGLLPPEYCAIHPRTRWIFASLPTIPRLHGCGIASFTRFFLTALPMSILPTAFVITNMHVMAGQSLHDPGARYRAHMTRRVESNSSAVTCGELYST